TAAVYLALMGPEGLSAAARLGVAKAHALAHRLGALPGCSVSTDGDFFDRFALRVPRLAPGREGSGYALRNALLVDNVLVEATAATGAEAKKPKRRSRPGSADARHSACPSSASRRWCAISRTSRSSTTPSTQACTHSAPAP